LRRGGLPPALLLLALSASMLQGCAGLSKHFRTTPPAKPPVAPPVAKPPVAPPAAKPPAIPAEEKLFAEGMTALQGGGHERALELFSAAWQEKPGHAGVAREFDGALLALKKNGDAAYALGQWEDAGKRWMGTLRYITHPAANSRGYPFTRSEVTAKVDHLSAALTEKALTEYRRGDVSSAIADWKTILAYDPGHEEAARSLRTASKQLETLKKMPPGK
jgi:thioredoxin-like negative regulator of GroEL